MSKHWERLTVNLPSEAAQPHFLSLIQQQLEASAGVKTAFLSSQTEMLYVVYDPHEVQSSELKSRIDQIFHTAIQTS